ncbi:unnamed protein product [Protopolystoma xenopodis]|uniref:Myosin tail domain-containing protein n=1 Tax=Protopolystoma xenopodis TaxID=117903 RepID=A0A448X4E1_9PLAT|nr:unnamed protein product [Protopolystoma xenopodis]
MEAELEEVTERLEEQGGATALQMDLNKKRDAENMKLKRELEEARIQHEQQIAVLRKKKSDELNEISCQLDLSNKAKVK